MQYESVSEKGRSTYSLTAKPTTDKDIKQNGDIRRVRTTVLVLLLIKLIFSLLYFANKVHNLVEYTRLPQDTRYNLTTGALIFGVVGAAISIIYLIIFIFVVIKYIRLGIIIFAWLAIIDFIFIVTIIIVSIIVLVTTNTTEHNVGVGIAASIVLIIATAVVSLLTLFTIFFSFKLAKLIKFQQGYQPL